MSVSPRPGGSLTGLLLVNLGSPDAPEPAAVRRYLAEFLGDPRVLEMPALLRRILLYGIILPRRSKTSAELYRSIWCKKGSPLLAICRKQADMVAAELDDGWRVELAMRYGNPSIGAGIDRLAEAGCRRIVLLTGFPQYSNTTVGSVYAEAFRVIAAKRDMPALQIVPPYHDDPEYVDAVADRIRSGRERFRADHVVLSFHGIPVRYAEAGDPYPEQCRATAAAIAKSAGLGAGDWTLTFQSRFGKEPWLEPYTDETLRKLAKTKRRVVIACPGFTADCLETIEEIARENREVFLEADGEDLRLIPCLNTNRRWIRAMADLARRAAGDAS